MSKIQLELANPKTLQMRLVKWDEVRELTHKANPYVAGLIDEAMAIKPLPLVLANYPYGVDIHLDGETYYPAPNNTLATIDEPCIDNTFKKLLSYNSCPLGLIINKACEVYIESDEGRSIPFKLFEPGTTFGVWEIMETPLIQMRKPWSWNISSGARTIFLLPSVNERNAFNKLKNAYGIKSHMPNTIFDQRKVFAEIAQHSNTDWNTQILYFPKEWLEDDSLALSKLKQHWYMEAWNQTQLWTHNIAFGYSTELFISELKKRRQTPKHYLIDTVKHLINIGSNTVTGFTPLTNSDLTIPCELIQSAYISTYKLKYYFPTLMQPGFILDGADVNYCYYSLQYPTLPEKPPELSNFPSVLKTLRELKIDMSVFIELIQQWPEVKANNKIDLLQNVTFDYFHSENDKQNEVKKLDGLLSEDPKLKSRDDIYGPRLQPETSHFFRGCVRIKYHKK